MLSNNLIDQVDCLNIFKLFVGTTQQLLRPNNCYIRKLQNTPQAGSYNKALSWYSTLQVGCQTVFLLLVISWSQCYFQNFKTFGSLSLVDFHMRRTHNFDWQPTCNPLYSKLHDGCQTVFFIDDIMWKSTDHNATFKNLKTLAAYHWSIFTWDAHTIF